jgi:hypothetical protein
MARLPAEGRPRAAAITPRSVRALFRAVLRGGDKVPGPHACRDVATWLQYVRLRRARVPSTHASGSHAAARAAAVLLAELRRLDRAYAQFPADIAKVPSLPFLENALREQAAIAGNIRAARTALERLGPILTPPRPDGPAWHADAAGLYRVFLGAMKEANPGRHYEPSNDGPAARFIRAAFLLALGEDRQEGTIAQVLKRRRQRGTTPAARLSRDRR